MNLPTSAGIVLCHGSHFLFIERGENAKHWPLFWGFPGGKIEGGESPLSAAIREVQEEIGVKIEEKNIVATTHIRAEYVEGVREHTLYLVNSWEGMPENLEKEIHREIRWCTLDDLPHPMIPHLRAGFEGLLRGETFLEYDGINL